MQKLASHLTHQMTAEVMVNERHLGCLREAKNSIEAARKGLLSGRPLELIASDLHVAAEALGKITGRNLTESLLNEIFSRFCIGK